MKYDEYGQACVTSKDLVHALYNNPGLDITQFAVTDPEQYNTSIKSLHLDSAELARYQKPSVSLEQFDRRNQERWLMPDSYVDLDIAEWVLNQCQTQAELQRVADELIKFQERNLFPLLCYLKYLVDTMRAHKVLWGVGRGSSVASYVLYLIGVHRIDSLYYDLDISEFLKD